MITDIAIITAGNLLDIVEPSGSPVFQNMLDIADGTVLPWGHDRSVSPIGQVHWHVIAPTYAIGRNDNADGGTLRIAVIDLDAADGLTAVMVTNWVNSLGELPTV